MEDVGLWSGSLFNLPSQVQVNHGSSELPYEVQFPRFFPSSPLETRCRVGLKDLRIETLRATAITTAEWYEGQVNERNALIRHMQDDSLVQQEIINALRMDNDYMQAWVNELINDQTNSLLTTELL